MRLIDADALIEFCAERWIPLNIDAVNMQPTIQPEKTQLFKEGTTFDLISRTETVEHLRRMLEATVPNTDYDEGFVDGVEFGVSTVSTMPTIQPEPTGIDAKEAVYNLAEKIGIHQLFALTVELRGEPIQPEPKEGHWINGKCDLCGEHAPFWCMASTYHESNYCPRCGAKMKGEAND